MSQPHKCPACDGLGKRGVALCQACEGKGVLWSPSEPQEAAVAPSDDPMDLSYRRPA